MIARRKSSRGRSEHARQDTKAAVSERSVGLKVELRALETRMRLQVFDALKNLLRSEAAGVGMRRARSSEERVRRSGSKERSR